MCIIVLNHYIVCVLDHKNSLIDRRRNEIAYKRDHLRDLKIADPCSMDFESISKRKNLHPLATNAFNKNLIQFPQSVIKILIAILFLTFIIHNVVILFYSKTDKNDRF